MMPVSEGSQACGVLGFAPLLPLSCGRVQKGFFTFWSWDQPVMERGARSRCWFYKPTLQVPTEGQDGWYLPGLDFSKGTSSFWLP